MQRDLERRLQAVETRWLGSPVVAAIVRELEAWSDDELQRRYGELRGTNTTKRRAEAIVRADYADYVDDGRRQFEAMIERALFSIARGTS